MERYVEKLMCFVDFARSVADLSTCKRKQTGAVIFPCDCTEVYAIGYNGPMRGLPNNSCKNVKGYCGCAHAEGNAIAKLKGSKPSIIVCTLSPCVYCANMIANAGTIVGCICCEAYRDYEGISLLMGVMKCLSVKGLNDYDQVREWRSIGSGCA